MLPTLLVAASLFGSTARGATPLIAQGGTRFFDKSVWAMLTFLPATGPADRFEWRYGEQTFVARRVP